MSAIGDVSQAIGDDLESTIFSKYIFKYLNQGILTGIYIKDDRFGNFDDMVFELNQTTLYCIQAKGSMQDKDITLGYFFTKEKKKDGTQKKSFLQNLYTSINLLKENFPRKVIKADIIFTLQPSTSKRYLPEKDGEKISFSFFIREIWNIYKQGNLTKEKILENELYRIFLKKFLDELNITFNELFEFFDNIDFVFNFKPRRAMSIEEFKRIEKFYSWYLNFKKNPINKGYYPLSFLEEQFTVSFKPNPHDFPIDIEKYVSLTKLREQILHRINENIKGYIFLTGGPSTGKSTFLTAEFNQENYQNLLIFKYLCFRDPSEHSLRPRGELDSYLGDLLKQFSNYIRLDHTKSLRDQFSDALNKLLNFGKKKNRKIVIIIDGIDHISREEISLIDKPFFLFLHNLGQLPENIFFIIGGQHFKDINWYDNSRETDLFKTFQIPSFGYEEIKIFIQKNYNNPELISEDLINVLLKKTQGNPWYLDLIIEKYLEYSQIEADIEIIKTQFLDFEGTWNDLYEKYWNIFFQNSSSDFKRIAGKISRIYGPIDIHWLKLWSDLDKIEQFLKSFDFLFKIYGNIIKFSQDSFKYFLREKSINFLGINISEKEYYKELAENCKIEGCKPHHNWFYIYYLKNAYELKTFSINRNYFLEQFLDGRPLLSILEDLRTLLEFYISINGVKSAYEIFLIKMEFEYREYYVNHEMNIDYFYLINPQIIENKYNLNFIVSLILTSTEISRSHKINFISNFILTQGLNTDVIALMIKDFLKINKTSLLEYDHNSKFNQENTKNFLKILFTTDPNKQNLLQLALQIIKNTFKRSLSYQQYDNDYYMILLHIGIFLIENNQLDQLYQIYNTFENIIIQEEYSIIINWGEDTIELISRKSDTIHLFGTPFTCILNLKYLEGLERGVNLVEELYSNNRIYRAFFNDSEILSHNKLFFSPDDINKNDINKLYDGFTIEQGYSRQPKAIQSMLRIYKTLLKHNKISKEILIQIFNEKYLREHNESSTKILWEFLFFDLSIEINKKFNNYEETEKIREIINTILVNLNTPYYTICSADKTRIFINYSDVIDAIIYSIKDMKILHNWIQERLRYSFIFYNWGFSSPLLQINIVESLLEYFPIVSIDLVKWVIENIKNNFNLNKIDNWNVSQVQYSCLKILNLMKEDYQEFTDRFIKIFIHLFEIVTFRLGPRKDWQLYALVYLLDCIISFFPVDDYEFIKDLNWVAKILDFAYDITESSEIPDIKYQLCEIIKKWNKDFFNDFSQEINLKRHEKYYNNKPNQKTPEKYKFKSSFIAKLKRIRENPQRLFLNICNHISKLKWDYRQEIKYSKLYESIEEDYNNPYLIWKRLFDYLKNLKKKLSLRDCHCSSFIMSFLNYYKEKTKQQGYADAELITLLVEFEKFRLTPPEDEFFQDTLKALYDLNKKECFNYGWHVFRNNFAQRGKNFSSYVMHDFIIYTFLSKLNTENYQFFWSKYMNYLRILFQIADV